MAKTPKLAFICTGNTCRSAMAQFILKDKLKQSFEFNLKVTSFGISVTEDKINEKARIALKKRGIKLTKFIPKQLDIAVVKGYDALVCMTDYIKLLLEKEGYVNVYSVNQLTGLGDITDPYGFDQTAYDCCCEKIAESCNVIYEMLKKVLPKSEV